MTLFLTTVLTAALTSFASGIIGSYVVVKRMVFLSGSIAHSVLGGMGLFLWLSKTYDLPFLKPIYGAFLTAILAAFLLGWIEHNYKQRKDAIIASIWSTGMAVGVIFISLTPGYNVELSNFLFGNILWVSGSDLMLLFVLDLFILVSVAIFYNQFLALCLDEEGARLQKIKTSLLYFFLLTLVAISIVLLIQIIGIILVLALLSLPPMIAGQFTKNLMPMMGLSFLLSLILSLFGLIFSFHFDWPIGATIALCCSFAYALTLILKKIVIRKLSLNKPY